MSIMCLLDVTIKYSFCRDWLSSHIFKPYFTFIYSHVTIIFQVPCQMRSHIQWTELTRRVHRDRCFPYVTKHYWENDCSGLLLVFILSMKAEGTLTFDVGEEQKPPPGGGVKDGLNETPLMPYLRPKPEKWDRFKAKTKTMSLTGAHKTSLNRFPNRNR